MSYCTQQDLIDRFGEQELVELTDRADPPAGLIDANVVAQAISDAGAEIDGYVGARYSLPLASNPESLKRIACDIARYRLYEDAVSEQVRTRYEDTMKFLAGVSRGLVSLGMPMAETPAQSVGQVLIDSSPRRFSRDRLDGF